MSESSLAQLKSELVQHYKWLRQHGCNDSHSGNASFRWHDQVWVTPTGCCADTLTADDLIRCELHGDSGQGASLDAPLHLKTYQLNPLAKAVFHSHGPHAIALSMMGEDFQPVDFEGQYYFPTVPVIDINYADYASLSPDMVAAGLSIHRVVMVRGHGVYTCAETINLAYKWSCSVELSAKITWLANQQ